MSVFISVGLLHVSLVPQVFSENQQPSTQYHCGMIQSSLCSKQMFSSICQHERTFVSLSLCERNIGLFKHYQDGMLLLSDIHTCDAVVHNDSMLILFAHLHSNTRYVRMYIHCT